MSKAKLSPAQHQALLKALKARFEKHANRHKGLEWAKVQARLDANADKLWSLHEMERTGGEPDVVGHDKKTGEFVFYDCSAESPKGRRSVCYDREALESRKEHKPKSNALDMAAAMGIDLLTEDAISRAADAWRVRYDDIKLGKNACCHQDTRRRHLLRSPLRPCLHVSQRSTLVLCRQGVSRFAQGLAVRGAIPAAFDGRCIPPRCVAPPSNIPHILGRRALQSGRLGRLGATRGLHHGLLDPGRDVPACYDFQSRER